MWCHTLPMGKVSDAISSLESRARSISVSEFQWILDNLGFTSRLGKSGKHMSYVHAGLAAEGFHTGTYNAKHDPVLICYVKDLLRVLNNHKARLLEIHGEIDE
jgi:hypothetical protein